MARSACAACRCQRKKCSNECLLAPHFPPDDLQRVAIVHQLYGIGRVVKLLKDVKQEQRVDLVKSLVYEARAKVEDPIYGCTREINQLQKQIADLESQLAQMQEELLDRHFGDDKIVPPVTVGCDVGGNVLCAMVEENEYKIREEVDPMLWEPIWKV